MVGSYEKQREQGKEDLRILEGEMIHLLENLPSCPYDKLIKKCSLQEKISSEELKLLNFYMHKPHLQEEGNYLLENADHFTPLGLPMLESLMLEYENIATLVFNLTTAILPVGIKKVIEQSAARHEHNINNPDIQAKLQYYRKVELENQGLKADNYKLKEQNTELEKTNKEQEIKIQDIKNDYNKLTEKFTFIYNFLGSDHPEIKEFLEGGFAVNDNIELNGNLTINEGEI